MGGGVRSGRRGDELRAPADRDQLHALRIVALEPLPRALVIIVRQQLLERIDFFLPVLGLYRRLQEITFDPKTVALTK
jgi:hypothetical protein